jgi:hypothetical protein
MVRSFTLYALPLSGTHEKTKDLCFDWEFQPEEEDMVDAINARRPNIAYWEVPYEDWCPRCLMFRGVFHQNPSVLGIHSMYSKNWRSDWCVENLFLGGSTPFTRLFESGFNEVDGAFFVDAGREFRHLGAPVRPSDKEAHDETVRVFDFITTWLAKAHILYECG